MKGDRTTLLQPVFLRLRREGLALGMDELLAALQAEQAGFGGDTVESLLEMLALLWCKSEAERWCLRRIWEEIEQQATQAHPARRQDVGSPTNAKPVNEPGVEHSMSETKPAVADGSGESFGIVPTRAPTYPPLRETLTELRHCYPLTRRSMRYAWRYLRRMIADGPRDVLDVEATIEQTARQGFFHAPVLRCRERNYAHLVLMLDHLGSMVPFHHYLRHLVETARYESALSRVDVYYFYNVPGDSLYADPLLKEEQIDRKRMLAGLSEFTAVLIVSDASAARRHHDLDRVLATLEFLEALRRVTTYVAWLNPMPAPRWQDTSAEVIARHVAMFPMSPDGLSNAVDVLRGLRPSLPH